MDGRDILNEFVKEVIKGTSVDGIIQFGSSTYIKNPDDFEVILWWNKISAIREYPTIRKMIVDFENKYPVAFDIDGRGEKGAKFKICIIPEDRNCLEWEDSQFFNYLTQNDENRKCLYGEDPFKNLKVKLTKKRLVHRLGWSAQFAEGLMLRDFEDGLSYLLKSVLRIMLVRSKKNVSEKQKLIPAFKETYPKINLPKNSECIINHKASKDDLDPVLKFTEKCIKEATK